MNIYEEAALRIFKGQNKFSCCAINYQNTTKAYEETRSFAELFAPISDDTRGFWLHHAQAEGQIKEKEMHNWRLTALCFASAMREAGDL